MHRPLRTKNDFKEFIAKIPGSRFMYIYVEHKAEGDKGLEDSIKPGNIRVGDNISLETVGPEVGVVTGSGITIEIDFVYEIRIRREIELKHKKSIGPVTRVGTRSGVASEIAMVPKTKIKRETKLISHKKKKWDLILELELEVVFHLRLLWYLKLELGRKLNIDLRRN